MAAINANPRPGMLFRGEVTGGAQISITVGTIIG